MSAMFGHHHALAHGAQEALRYCGAVFAGVGCTVAAALLIPAGRALAWLTLLGTVVALDRLAGREAGLAAGAAAGFAYICAHSGPRFAATITDSSAIRLGFLLVAAGAFVVAVDEWLRHWKRDSR
jgi:sugar phosphate permease